MAGRNMWPALIGFIITGVGLPLLGVAALGISRSSGLFELSSHIGRPYGYFFTCALYLTIGPFFAIPRAEKHAEKHAGNVDIFAFAETFFHGIAVPLLNLSIPAIADGNRKLTYMITFRCTKGNTNYLMGGIT